AGLLALSGSIEGFWRWTVESLVGYASENWTPANLWSRAQDSLVPFVLFGAAAWIAALAFAARWRSLRPAERLAVIWLLLSLAGSLAGGHLAWHYFIQVMAPLALLAALALEAVLNWERRRWVAAVAILAMAAPAVY